MPALHLRRAQRAFTLIELLVAIALAVIVLALAAPAFQDFIVLQRLKSVNAQLVTDLMLARSEAVSRNASLRVVLDSDSTSTCYTLYTAAANNIRCDCKLGPGAACSGFSATQASEVRTVSIPRSGSVRLDYSVNADSAFAFSAVTGGMSGIPLDTSGVNPSTYTIDTTVDAARTLRTVVGRAGRVTVCGVSANLGVPAC